MSSLKDKYLNIPGPKRLAYHMLINVFSFSSAYLCFLRLIRAFSNDTGSFTSCRLGGRWVFTLRKLLAGLCGLRQPCTPGGSSSLQPTVKSWSLSQVSRLFKGNQISKASLHCNKADNLKWFPLTFRRWKCDMGLPVCQDHCTLGLL